MAAVSVLHAFIPSVCKFVAMVAVVASSLQVAMSQESWCTASSCGDNRVCCGENGCIIASNCLGLYCSSDSDCSKSESCCNSECSNTTSCLGKWCIHDSDCSSGQSCCNHECRDSPDCVGYFCNSESDCAKWELCCDGTCSKADCLYIIPTVSVDTNDNTVFIVATLLGSLAFGLLGTLCIFVCRRQRAASVSVAGQGVLPVHSNAVEQPAQIYPPGQVPPSYQHGYNYYPTPQYEQQQAKAGEQPPHYNTTLKESSGGGRPQKVYGAIPSPSPPEWHLGEHFIVTVVENSNLRTRTESTGDSNWTQTCILCLFALKWYCRLNTSENSLTNLDIRYPKTDTAWLHATSQWTSLWKRSLNVNSPSS